MLTIQEPFSYDLEALHHRRPTRHATHDLRKKPSSLPWQELVVPGIVRQALIYRPSLRPVGDSSRVSRALRSSGVFMSHTRTLILGFNLRRGRGSRRDSSSLSFHGLDIPRNGLAFFSPTSRRVSLGSSSGPGQRRGRLVLIPLLSPVRSGRDRANDAT